MVLVDETTRGQEASGARSAWRRMTDTQKCLSGNAVFCKSAMEFDRAWDIVELYSWSSTGFRESSRSVSVNGRCYDAAAVNYVLYGWIGRLCASDSARLAMKNRRVVTSWSDVWGKAKSWKEFAYGHAPGVETKDWTWAGWKGWPLKFKNLPRSTTPYRVLPERIKKDLLRAKWRPTLDPGGRR